MPTCRSCNKREGSPYEFVYGNRLPEIVDGRQSEPICDTCIRQAKTAGTLSGVINFLVVNAAIVGAYFLWRKFIFLTPKQYMDQALINCLFLSGVFLLVAALWLRLAYVMVRSFFLKKQRLGEGLALMADKEEFGKKYAQLWTLTKYKKAVRN